MSFFENLQMSSMNGNNDEEINFQMFVASKQGNLEKVISYLRKGADINYTSGDQTTFSVAVYNDQNNVVDHFLENCDKNILKKAVNASNKYHWSVLHEVTSKNENDLVKKFIEFGASSNRNKIDGNTPMLISVINENEDLVNHFLEQGYNVDSVNNEGNTALHLAVISRNIKIINLILNKNPDFNALNNNNEKAIDLTDDPEIINLLKNYENRKNLLDSNISNKEDNDVNNTNENKIDVVVVDAKPKGKRVIGKA